MQTSVRKGCLWFVALALIMTTTASCARMGRMGLDLASPAAPSLVDNVMTMDDLRLGREGLPGLIVLLSGLVEFSPENLNLLTVTAMSYTAYALMVEDEDPEYARRLYTRGKEYGLRALRTDRRFDNALGDNEMRIMGAVEHIDRKRAPAAFWTGMSWAGWMFLNMDDTAALLGLPNVLALMKRCEELDEGYFFGGVHLFHLAYNAVMPGFAGGGPEKVAASLEKAASFTDDHFMLPYVYHARFFSRPYGRRDLFRSYLTRVTEFETTRPELNLANAIARSKAEYLLQKEDEYFKYD